MTRWKLLTFSWPSNLISTLAILTTALLLLFPILWILRGRTLDPIGLFLSQHAFQILGYFFLGTTAYNIPNNGDAILGASGLVILINFVGTVVLITSLEINYFFVAHTNRKIPPLPSDWETREKMALWILRGIAVVTILAILTPMVITGAVPALMGNTLKDRYVLDSSDLGRALYHVGTGLLPFVVAGLTVAILLKPIRFFTFDGIAIVVACLLQMLTANRLPLALAVTTTASLVSLQFKWPRWILLGSFVIYIFCFVFLGGLSAYLRLSSDQPQDRNIIQASFEEAYLGNTLIDVRDASWVFGNWDFDPLAGKTYLGGLLSFLPSGLFPQKKDWHLGLTCIRTVGWPEETHFGVRITPFGEAFFNFGFLGVIFLATVLGILFAFLLRLLHLAAKSRPPSFLRNLTYLLIIQMLFPLTNSSDSFLAWVFVVTLIVLTGGVRLLTLLTKKHQSL